jgi:hypothetical protein
MGFLFFVRFLGLEYLPKQTNYFDAALTLISDLSLKGPDCHFLDCLYVQCFWLVYQGRVVTKGPVRSRKIKPAHLAFDKCVGIQLRTVAGSFDSDVRILGIDPYGNQYLLGQRQGMEAMHYASP